MSAAAKPSYSFTNFSVPGAFETAASGINDFGQIVGTVLANVAPAGDGVTPKTVGYLDTQGSFRFLDVAGSVQTDAEAINNLGQVVGFYSGSSGEHGFLYKDGTFTTIDVPGATLTVASGINDFGQIVGHYMDATGIHAFVDTNGHIKTINVPGATYTTFPVINDLGQILGQYQDNSGNHSFLDINGHITTITVPGATFTTALGLNNLGQIVGYYSDATGDHGFIDSFGKFTTLNTPGASTLSGINDLGQIVGTTLFQGLLGTPVGPGAGVASGSLADLLSDAFHNLGLADLVPALPSINGHAPQSGSTTSLSDTHAGTVSSAVLYSDNSWHALPRGSSDG